MSDYQLGVIRQVWVLVLFYPVVSAIYYMNSKSIAQSAHGALALMVLALSLVMQEKARCIKLMDHPIKSKKNVQLHRLQQLTN